MRLGQKHKLATKKRISKSLKGRKISKKTVQKRLLTRRKNLIPLSVMFWKKVSVIGKCWEWKGSVNLHPNKGGYGYLEDSILRSGKKIKAHRLSWQIHFGKIPEGLSVLHRCDNRKCVNPKHLFLGTQLDNMRDRFLKGRRIVKKHD